MWDLKVCRACLATGVKLFHIQKQNFQISYESLSGLKITGVDGMPLNVCAECASLLKKYTTFRKKCRRAHFTLKQFLDNKIELTEDYIKAFDRNKVKLTSLIAPCALPQTVITISDKKCYNGIFDSTEPAYRFTMTSVDVPPRTVAQRVRGKKVECEKETSLKVEKAAKVESHETVAESSQISFSIENGAIVVLPSGLNRSLKVETNNDYYDKFEQDDNTFDNDDFKQINESVVTNNSAMENDEVTLCVTSEEIHSKNAKTTKKINDSVMETKNRKAPSKKVPRKRVVKSISKEKLKTIKSNKTQAIKDFSIVSLSMLEQRDEMEKRKNSSNYLYAAYKCEWCYRGFLEEKTFLSHQQKHDVGVSGRFGCEMCHLMFVSRYRLLTHINTNHSRKFTCNLCSFSCFNRSQAHSHHAWHKGVTYTCKQCGEIFKRRSTHLSHLRIKHPSEFKCTLCPNTFVSEAGVIAHKRLAHKDIILFQKSEPQDIVNSNIYCTLCGVQFESVPAYTKHVLNAPGHPSRTIMNGCASCGESFMSRKELTQHSQSHHRHVKCARCNRLLKDSSKYKAHRRCCARPFAKKFICEWCGKSAASNALLRIHIRIHTGEKPFKCQLCPKAFAVKMSLEIHLKSHSDERPFPCATCGKAFKVKNALERHEKIHSALRPFKCTICDKTYNLKFTLKQHIRYVHNKVPWPARKRRERRVPLPDEPSSP